VVTIAPRSILHGTIRQILYDIGGFSTTIFNKRKAGQARLPGPARNELAMTDLGDIGVEKLTG
jgi:hypothetical protein